MTKEQYTDIIMADIDDYRDELAFWIESGMNIFEAVCRLAEEYAWIDENN